MVKVNGAMVPPLGTQDPGQSGGGVNSGDPVPGMPGRTYGGLDRNWEFPWFVPPKGKRPGKKHSVKSPYVSVVPDAPVPTRPGQDKKDCSARIYVHLALNAKNCPADKIAVVKDVIEKGAGRLGGKCPCPPDKDGPGISVQVVVVWHPKPSKPGKLDGTPGVGSITVDCGISSPPRLFDTDEPGAPALPVPDDPDSRGNPATGEVTINSDPTNHDNESLVAHEIGHLLFGDEWATDGSKPDDDVAHNPKSDGVMGGGKERGSKASEAEVRVLAKRAGLSLENYCWPKETPKEMPQVALLQLQPGRVLQVSGQSIAGVQSVGVWDD